MSAQDLLDWGTTTLPWCSYATTDGRRRVGVGVGTHVLDVAAALPDLVDELADGTLDALLAHPSERRAAPRRRTGRASGGDPCPHASRGPRLARYTTQESRRAARRPPIHNAGVGPGRPPVHNAGVGLARPLLAPARRYTTQESTGLSEAL